MQTIDRLIQLVISVFLIVGVYQFYFWCQRNQVTQPREFRLPLDDRIPYRPRWVWIYSFLYYPIIVAINWTVTSPRHFLYVAISFMLLLGFQMVFFVLLPVATPAEWRTCVTGKGRSERFLAFVQSFDARSNSFPSMHTSVATLTALHLYRIRRTIGVRVPRVDRAELSLHETTLHRGSACRRAARLVRVQIVSSPLLSQPMLGEVLSINAQMAGSANVEAETKL